MTHNKTVTNRIAELRAAKRYTQDMLAILVGVSRESIARYETGTRHPSVPRLTKIAQVLGCSPGDLLDSTEDPATDTDDSTPEIWRELFESGLDFIERASAVSKDDSVSEELQLKFSSIDLYAGIELILKARLAQEHWVLVLMDNQSKRTRAMFDEGDVLTVDYEKARDRLRGWCGVDISAEADRAINELRLLRNRYQHFAIRPRKPLVIATQLRAWECIFRLLNEGLVPDLSTADYQRLNEIVQGMHFSKEFLDSFVERVRAEAISGKRGLAKCYQCDLMTCLLGDGEIECRLCCETFDAEDYAGEYAHEIKPDFGHPKHGLDDEILTCPECDRETVVPLGVDLAAELCVIPEYSHLDPDMAPVTEDRSGVLICVSCLWTSHNWQSDPEEVWDGSPDPVDWEQSGEQNQ